MARNDVVSIPGIAPGNGYEFLQLIKSFITCCRLVHEGGSCKVSQIQLRDLRDRNRIF